MDHWVERSILIVNFTRGRLLMFAPNAEKLIIEPSAPLDFQKSLRFSQGFPATQHK